MFLIEYFEEFSDKNVEFISSEKFEVFSDFLKKCFDLEKFQIQKVRNAE